ncbi:Homeodomain-like superfamily protein [Thalictrum thalictroides]|uniref:Homeodomain-like superfamily protein n=1 Tax=Thalictrum thalictroides TaxID=46969 RepID=A0A7J6WV33_THATH|nr:Homeodomain-like superfamily protein [Thalictrum thalictroides]
MGKKKKNNNNSTSTNTNINEATTTPLRRSKRILELSASKSNNKVLQVYISPLSSSAKTHFKSPISLVVQNVSCKNSIESFKGSAKSMKLNNGSEKSGRIVNGVEGFQGRRHSPRLLYLQNSTPDISDGKSCGKKSNYGGKISSRKIDGFQSCRRSPRFSIRGNTPEVKNCGKTSNGFERVTMRKIDGVTMSTPETFEKKKCTKWSSGSKILIKKISGVENVQACRVSPRFPIMGKTSAIINKKSDFSRVNNQVSLGNSIEDSLEGTQKRKSIKRGRQSLSGQPEVGMVTPNNGKGKKKQRNVNCGANGNQDKSDGQHCKEIDTLQEVHKITPLSSIENKAQLLCHEKNSKKLVATRIGLNKSAKPEERSLVNQCGLRGWTKDQEVALQRAYFAAKPSPHIWKKISRLVPGKSAQDCFDKVQLDSITPPETRPRSRSRANKTNASPLGHFSLSGSILLEPDKLSVKRPRGSKGTKCRAQKTARHLLQKQNLLNQGCKADLFTILEPTACSLTIGAPETNALSTPKCTLDKQRFSQHLHQRSLSVSKKPLSRFSDSTQIPLASPPVLKNIKNMAFHEKYIDQLHIREAKRTGGRRECVSGKKKGKEINVIKAAKNALVSDARDFIKKFEHLQANAVESSDDFDDDNYDSSSGGDGE